MRRGSDGMIFGIEEKRRRVGGRDEEMHLERGPKLPPWLLRWSSILRAWKVGTFGADEGIRKIGEAEDERTEVGEINEKRWYARKRRWLREN
jgi:hypothetical protein